MCVRYWVDYRYRYLPTVNFASQFEVYHLGPTGINGVPTGVGTGLPVRWVPVRNPLGTGNQLMVKVQRNGAAKSIGTMVRLLMPVPTGRSYWK